MSLGTFARERDAIQRSWTKRSTTVEKKATSAQPAPSSYCRSLHSSPLFILSMFIPMFILSDLPSSPPISLSTHEPPRDHDHFNHDWFECCPQEYPELDSLQRKLNTLELATLQVEQLVTKLHQHCIDALIVEESDDGSELAASDHEEPELVRQASLASVGSMDFSQEPLDD
jgi:hypothetical protein